MISFNRKFLFSCVIALVVLGCVTQGNKDNSIQFDGDIILGGLFPMHEKGTQNNICGLIKVDKGIQRVEAMLFAIDKINKDPQLLRNISLGVHILDTCLRDTYGLEQSLEFIKTHLNTEYQCPGGDTPVRTPTKPVVGVIGASASPVSIMVANMLRLFKIPQISYASTGIELSDKGRFEFFSRVVPPDTYQAQAMVDIVRALGWTYISTVADAGDYGEKGIGAFADGAKQSGICIARSLQIPREVRRDTYVKIINDLLEYPKAKVIVMFVNEDNCRHLLECAEEMNKSSNFFWLASDSWGAKTHPVRNQEEVAEGAVTILPQRNVLPEFDRYFKNLTVGNNVRNPWFGEFWEEHFKCTFRHVQHHFRTGRPKCTGRERISKENNYEQEGLVPFVVDAVYAMAHALEDLHKQICPYHSKVCPNMKTIKGEDLLYHIRHTEFRGVTGHVVGFNENGDAMGRYTIYQFQRTEPDKYKYISIGNWTDRLDLNMDMLKWKQGKQELPKSVCSDPCPPGQVRNSKGTDSCCWVCVECRNNDILRDEHTCEACPKGFYPNFNKSTCIGLPVQYMSLDSPWALVPVIFSILGILLITLIFLVFVKYNNTPVIMASGRELCYVLLLGLFLSYSMTFFMVAKPTVATCTFLRLGLGFSLCLCYAALFTKTNRISRIFNRGVKAMVKRPSYTSPKSQLVICFCLVSIQVVAAITWIIMEFPDTTKVFPDNHTVVLRCKSNNVSIVLSLLYNMILIIMCTIYALKTRKIPENFNEAKYIAFTMYSTCIVWLAFIPIYFGTHKSDFRIQITALCMCVSISATVAIGCLFVPKIYIVLFQPHKNVRQGTKGGPGSHCGRPFFGRPGNRLGAMGAMNGDITSPTGLALLIAQSTAGALARREPAPPPPEEDASEPMKDLDSDPPDNSDTETNL